MRANGPGVPFLLPFQSLPAVVENETVLGLDLIDLCIRLLDDVRLLALVFPVPDDDTIPYGKVCHESPPWLALLVADRVTRVRHEMAHCGNSSCALRESPVDPPRLPRERSRPS